MITVTCPCGAFLSQDYETIPREERLAAVRASYAFFLKHRPHIEAAKLNAATEVDWMGGA